MADLDTGTATDPDTVSDPRADDRAFEESLCDLARPIRLGGTYRRRVERLEALAENRSGADRSWVEHVSQRSRDDDRRARRAG